MHSNDRREFLKVGGAALAATAVSWNARSYARSWARTIAYGGHCRMRRSHEDGDIPAFQSSAKEMNFEIVAVSDIWNRRREEGAAYIQKLSGNTVDPVRNNDELYARKDIDAVMIATADFQHARHGIEAVKAGRDAYVEKPTAHTMEDARKFLAAVQSSGQDCRRSARSGARRPATSRPPSTSSPASSATS